MQNKPRIIDVLTEDQLKRRRQRMAALIPFIAANITVAVGLFVEKIPADWGFPFCVINAVLFVTTIYLREKVEK